MKYLLVTIFSIIFFDTYSQTVSLNGRVMDTSEKKPLSNAAILLVNYHDSVLYAFKRAANEGDFVFSNITPGKYRLLITYPTYATLLDVINLSRDFNLGVISLTPTATILAEVIIRGGRAISIKGDTTEFKTDSFIVKEGATVEELLKILPGFQVNSKGEIAAQGRRVDKVLVDGEEFFGDDPTMATQNLSSKAVDKVQIYDTKTDHQNLTGISTGNEGKTVNIQLKQSHKKGAFGKVYSASDFSKHIDGKVLYNRFVDKKKVSAYGTKSNLYSGSLNSGERQRLGINDDTEYDEISGYYYSITTSDGFNDVSIRGLPNSHTVGALYSNKFSHEKHGINISYRLNDLRTENIASTHSQFLRKNSTDYRNVFTTSFNWNQQHALYAKYEWKIDSFTSLKLINTGLRKTTNLSHKTQSEFLDGTKSLKNNSDQVRQIDITKFQFDNLLMYRQLFQKKNRQLIGTFRVGVVDEEQEGTVTTLARFYKSGLQDSTSLVDQMKIVDGIANTVSVKMTFTEPLTSELNVVVDYSYTQNLSTSYRNTYNKAINGRYEDFDSDYSNNLDLKALSQTGIALLRYVGKKTRFTVGSGFSRVKLKLLDIDEKVLNEYEFMKVSPQAQYNYSFKPQTTVTANYSGRTIQPSLTNFQPVKDNTDPLNIFVGNPNLKVGFQHTVRLTYYQNKVMLQKYLYVTATYNLNNNAIVNSILFDTITGKQRYSPTNVNGLSTWSINTSWNKGGGEKKVQVSFNVDANGGKNINFLDNDKNIITYCSYSASISAYYGSTNRHTIGLSSRVGYSNSSSTIRSAANNNYFSYGGAINGFKMLRHNIELRSDVLFDLREKIHAFSTNSNVINWNLSLGRKMFKDKSGYISFVAVDILNQNTGFLRTINSSVVSEDRYSRIGRYMLLRLEWSFNKMPQTK